jgi:iron complex outermembrane receptor protein
MIKHIAYLFLFTFAGLVMVSSLHAQATQERTTISGSVVDDATGETLAGVNVRVKDRVIGTSSDIRGQYSLTVRLEPPFTLVFSMLGYRSKEIEITESSVIDLVVRIEESAIIGDEIVVSASRVEQRLLDSPVSIERLDAISIRESASPNFYEALGNLKGVDFSTQSLTFNSVNTRGFAANGNTRFVQLIDGIDNQAPGLNFPVGNVVGISDLDLESAELMPGVSSALYGPNAINGILLLNSKSPFEYPGLSVRIQTGLNHVDARDDDASFYQSYAFRYAQSFNNRFAFKANFSYLKATDFIGVDTRDQGLATYGAVERGDTSRGDNRLYDGVNVYGQPLVSLGQIADGLIRGGNTQIEALRSLIPDGQDGLFTPNGFAESSFVNNTAESLKLNAALHYILSDNMELLGQFNWGTGSTVYTANDRFVLDDFSIWTAKLELRNPNFFARVYTTQEDAGDTYAANTLASLINVQTFIPAYFETFVGARTQGATVDEAHDAARAAGISAQPQPGSEQFEQLFDEIRDTPISEGGARFLDRSGMWHGEVMYNFSNIVNPEQLEIIAGANVRRFALNSEGTLFALKDDGSEFDMDEFGTYVQLGRGFLDNRLRLQGSLRYDKNEFFAGQFSPRFSATYTLLGNHTFRASFQRGFRIPTTQDQFIDLDVVTRRLIGNNPLLVDRYNFESNTVYRTESVEAARDALASGASAEQARQGLVPVEFEQFRTEKVSTFEVGYKSQLGRRLFVDAYYYFSSYSDFIAEIDFTQAIPNGLRQDPGAFDPDSDAGKDAIINRSVAIQRFGFDVNADGNVEANGFAVGADLNFYGNYTIGGNVAYNRLISQQDLIDQGFRASFNTPEWRFNLQLQNRRLTPRLGFNVNFRWQDAFTWESSIGEGVIDAFGTLDAQVSYRFPELNSSVKLSGTNILNNRHTTSFANPSLGSIFLLTFTFDQFMN